MSSTHRAGHWIGMDVHDAGDYRKKGIWQTLQTGHGRHQREPGGNIRPDAGAGALEHRCPHRDDVLITATGNDNLTVTTPKTIAEVEGSLPARWPGPNTVKVLIVGGGPVAWPRHSRCRTAPRLSTVLEAAPGPVVFSDRNIALSAASRRFFKRIGVGSDGQRAADCCSRGQISAARLACCGWTCQRNRRQCWVPPAPIRRSRSHSTMPPMRPASAFLWRPLPCVMKHTPS